MANLKEEVMARLLDRTWPDAVLAIYKESPAPTAIILQAGDVINFNLVDIKIMVQNTSQKDIYLRGEQ